jgi:hypothetical protein
MNLPEDTRLAYIVWDEAWWSRVPGQPADHPHLMVQVVSRDGVVAWEFQVDGYGLSGPVTRVTMFQDAYAAFAQIPEFFEMLAGQQPVTLTEVRDILHALGAVDETPRTSPYPER